MRKLPRVSLSPCGADYAQLAAQGFDYWQEAFALHLLPAFVESLNAAKEEAKRLSDDLDATVPYDLNGEKFQICATGAKGGHKWVLKNDDLIILIGSPKREWPVSVRHLSAGLWEHGIDALRARALRALAPFTRPRRPDDFILVTRFDYCFDFYSPAFRPEFTPRLPENVVCHSRVKTHSASKCDLFSRGPRGETLTIGSRRGLQVQLYDKTLEIHERSGKTWLYGLWAEEIGEWPWLGRPCDVYRLECRFPKAFLKQRNLRTPQEVIGALRRLIGEALYTRRLTVPKSSDTHKHRRALHPFWSEAVRQFKPDAILPIGRKTTGRRNALLESGLLAFAGSLRSLTVLKCGDYDAARATGLTKDALALIERDPHHRAKIEAARNRYSDIDEAA